MIDTAPIVARHAARWGEESADHLRRLLLTIDADTRWAARAVTPEQHVPAVAAALFACTALSVAVRIKGNDGSDGEVPATLRLVADLAAVHSVQLAERQPSAPR